MIPPFGDQNSSCWGLAKQKNATQQFSPHDGIIVSYTSYLWCQENCSQFHLNVSADFLLVLMGFALPAVIFSTVVPRRWRLDLPEQLFKVSRTRIFSAAKLLLSIPAVCIVATLDMIGWITCIMTFAGPMVFSGIQEMLLDFRVVRSLNGNQWFSAREKLEAGVALLCGNFDQDPDDPMTRIHAKLIPLELTEASLESTKSRLITIMNAQGSFGMTIGIPTVFFLGGFVYNATQAAPAGAVSFGIFWMVLVLATIIAGTLLAGNSPHTVSMLVVNNHIRSRRTRRVLFRDMYDSELYPVAMWDRGFSKYQWLKTTTMWQDPGGSFRRRIEIGWWSWATIAMATWLLVATPCLLSWSYDYFIPWPWFGCMSLFYCLYLISQTWLILAALTLAYLDVPFHAVWRPFGLLPKGTSQPILLKFSLLVFAVLTAGATLAAALLALVTSVFQFTDRFETCICSMPVSYWMVPASQRLSFVTYEYTSPIYGGNVNLVNFGLFLGATFFTCIVCFLGWWYQQALRVALRATIESIE
jgi:hypothetical protein